MAACGGDSPNVISAIASWLEEMVRATPPITLPHELTLAFQVRHYDSREWTATADGLKRTKEFAVSVSQIAAIPLSFQLMRPYPLPTGKRWQKYLTSVQPATVISFTRGDGTVGHGKLVLQSLTL